MLVEEYVSGDAPPSAEADAVATAPSATAVEDDVDERPPPAALGTAAGAGSAASAAPGGGACAGAGASVGDGAGAGAERRSSPPARSRAGWPPWATVGSAACRRARTAPLAPGRHMFLVADMARHHVNVCECEGVRTYLC